MERWVWFIRVSVIVESVVVCFEVCVVVCVVQGGEPLARWTNVFEPRVLTFSHHRIWCSRISMDRR